MIRLTVLVVLIVVFLLGSAAAAVRAEAVIDAIVHMSVFSVLLAILFVILQAPDVAMAEAVIGAGLLTAFYVAAVNKAGG